MDNVERAAQAALFICALLFEALLFQLTIILERRKPLDQRCKSTLTVRHPRVSGDLVFAFRFCFSLLIYPSHMSSPSSGGKFLQNAQEVRFSDVATWMSHRNGRYFLSSAGNRSELGRLSFAYFSFMKAIHGFHPPGSYAVQIAPAICGRDKEK